MADHHFFRRAVLRTNLVLKLLAGATGAALLAGYCGRAVTVVHRFDLPACPPDSFRLPDVVRRDTLRLTGGSPSNLCPEAREYTLGRRDGGARFDVRLMRGPRCALDVAGHYFASGWFGGLGAKPNRDMEVSIKPHIEAVAGLVLEGSGIRPEVPASRVASLMSDADRLQWCVAGHRPDRLLPAAGSNDANLCDRAQRPNLRLELGEGAAK
jgi:hypothetical protein